MVFKVKQHVLVFIGVIFTQIIGAGNEFPDSWLDARETEARPLHGMRSIKIFFVIGKETISEPIFSQRYEVPVKLYRIFYPGTQKTLDNIVFAYLPLSNIISRVQQEVENFLTQNVFDDRGRRLFRYPRHEYDPSNYSIHIGNVKVFDTKNSEMHKKFSRRIFYAPIAGHKLVDGDITCVFDRWNELQ